MKRIIITLLISCIGTTLLFAQSNLDEIEETIKNKIENCFIEFYKGNPENYGDLFIETGILSQEGFRVEGKEQIKNTLSQFPIPPATTYDIQFFPLTKIDSSYVIRYIVKENNGFTAQNIEVWDKIDGDFKIVYANMAPLPSDNSGMSFIRLVLSSLVIGLSLFFLLVVYKNARKWKKK